MNSRIKNFNSLRFMRKEQRFCFSGQFLIRYFEKKSARFNQLGTTKSGFYRKKIIRNSRCSVISVSHEITLYAGGRRDGAKRTTINDKTEGNCAKARLSTIPMSGPK